MHVHIPVPKVKQKNINGALALMIQFNIASRYPIYNKYNFCWSGLDIIIMSPFITTKWTGLSFESGITWDSISIGLSLDHRVINIVMMLFTVR